MGKMHQAGPTLYEPWVGEGLLSNWYFPVSLSPRPVDRQMKGLLLTWKKISIQCTICCVCSYSDIQHFASDAQWTFNHANTDCIEINT
jgi:hypothetical protein